MDFNANDGSIPPLPAPTPPAAPSAGFMSCRTFVPISTPARRGALPLQDDCAGAEVGDGTHTRTPQLL